MIIRSPETSIELLIPDFKGLDEALRMVVDARPDILNHNLETIERLYRIARPGGRYPRALELLRRVRVPAPTPVWRDDTGSLFGSPALVNPAGTEIAG